jgi:hypothetical protein
MKSAKCRDASTNPPTISDGRRRVSRGLPAWPPEQDHLVRLALNEAEALAWQTGFPRLFLPNLAMEKVDGILSWLRRQQLIQRKRIPVPSRSCEGSRRRVDGEFNGR